MKKAICEKIRNYFPNVFQSYVCILNDIGINECHQKVGGHVYLNMIYGWIVLVKDF